MHEAWYIPCNPENTKRIIDTLRPVFEDERIAKIGQNVKFDIMMLRSAGTEVRGMLYDTMIIHYLLDPESRHGMDHLARTLLNYSPVPIEELIGKGVRQITMDRVPIEKAAAYAAEDADVTLRLQLRLWPQLQQAGLEELYRTIEEPLIRVLADIEMTGWKGECDFIDPMCGSGTIAIEAALIARNISPGVFRKEFAFEKWNDFDQDLFDTIYNDDSQEREFEHHIYGYDVDMKAVNTANLNVRAAGLSKDITISQADFKDFTQPAEKSIIVMNPPYGERISTPNLLNTYKMIGERFKKAFAGNEAWVLSYREECFEQIGLKPSIKIPVFNGSLECEFRKYVMFDGKMKDFRSEGGIVKTEREKSEMAQKHRFKKEREFKKRVSEETENEEDDIRSFKFHTHRLEDFEKKRAEFHKGGRSRIGGGRRNDDDDDKRGSRSFKSDRKGGRDFGSKRDGKRFEKGDKRGGFKGDKRGGRDFGGKRGGKKNFSGDFDDED